MIVASALLLVPLSTSLQISHKAGAVPVDKSTWCKLGNLITYKRHVVNFWRKSKTSEGYAIKRLFEPQNHFSGTTCLLFNKQQRLYKEIDITRMQRVITTCNRVAEVEKGITVVEESIDDSDDEYGHAQDKCTFSFVDHQVSLKPIFRQLSAWTRHATASSEPTEHLVLNEAETRKLLPGVKACAESESCQKFGKDLTFESFDSETKKFGIRFNFISELQLTAEEIQSFDFDVELKRLKESQKQIFCFRETPLSLKKGIFSLLLMPNHNLDDCQFTLYAVGFKTVKSYLVTYKQAFDAKMDLSEIFDNVTASKVAAQPPNFDWCEKRNTISFYWKGKERTENVLTEYHKDVNSQLDFATLTNLQCRLGHQQSVSIFMPIKSVQSTPASTAPAT